jgi:hypothetical protein
MSSFNRASFESATDSERGGLCARLALELNRGLAEAPSFHEAVAKAVSDLRALGHDLSSLDAAEDFELWGPDYAQSSGQGIVITFCMGEPTEVDWSTGGRFL